MYIFIPIGQVLRETDLSKNKLLHGPQAWHFSSILSMIWFHPTLISYNHNFSFFTSIWYFLSFKFSFFFQISLKIFDRWLHYFCARVIFWKCSKTFHWFIHVCCCYEYFHTYKCIHVFLHFVFLVHCKEHNFNLNLFMEI